MPDSDNTEPLIYLVAGESSGDALGADLIDSVRAMCPSACFAGVGGPQMISRGIDSLFPMSDLSVMGIAEILPRLRLLLRRMRETSAHVRQLHPDIVVTIDSPDFSFRVAKRLKGCGIPLVHYVAPTVWAWRPKRAGKIARIYDHLFTLFPFEPPYFEKEGLASTFVGHPVLHHQTGDGDAFRRNNRIDADTPILCLLPGSRRSEVSRLLPVFLATVEKLRQQFPTLHIVIPTVPHLEDDIKSATETIQNIDVVGQDQKSDALAASTTALAASGTIALELAMAGVPSVIAYRLNEATAILARRLIRIPYKSLVNILLKREVMPERIQEECTPGHLHDALLPLFHDQETRDEQLAAFRQVQDLLSPHNGSDESEEASHKSGGTVAARQLLAMIGSSKEKTDGQG